MSDQDGEFRTGGVCHLLWYRHEEECAVNVGSWLSAASQLYTPSGTADMRRAETTVMTWWGTRGLCSHTTTIFIKYCMGYKLCVKSCVCVCVNIPLRSFLSGLCLMWCSHSGSLSSTPIKREGCPLPATLRHASPASRERGPIIYYLFPSC